jgi:hypothetical protein
MAPICHCAKLMQNCTARSIRRNHAHDNDHAHEILHQFGTLTRPSADQRHRAHENASKKREWKRPLTEKIYLFPLIVGARARLGLTFKLRLGSEFL